MAIRLKDDSYKWPHPIKFDIKDNFPHPERVYQGIALVEEGQAVKFEHIKAGSTEAHMLFWPSRGCASQVGKRVKSGPQEIYISEDCDAGAIAHEIMHCLGFHHEHQRPDRDAYVKIIWSEVSDEKNFLMLNEDIYVKTEYDPWSRMHYGAYAGGKSGFLPTIHGLTHETRVGLLSHKWGLSTIDIKALRDWYGHNYETQMTIVNNSAEKMKYYIMWKTYVKVGDTDIDTGKTANYEDVKDSFFKVGIKRSDGTPLCEFVHVPIHSTLMIEDITEKVKDGDKHIDKTIGQSVRYTLG